MPSESTQYKAPQNKFHVSLQFVFLIFELFRKTTTRMWVTKAWGRIRYRKSKSMTKLQSRLRWWIQRTTFSNLARGRWKEPLQTKGKTTKFLSKRMLLKWTTKLKKIECKSKILKINSRNWGGPRPSGIISQTRLTSRGILTLAEILYSSLKESITQSLRCFIDLVNSRTTTSDLNQSRSRKSMQG